MVTGGRKIKFSDKKSARPVLNFASDIVQSTAGASARGSALACRQSVDGVYVKSEVVYTLKTVDL
jgi:hypothetical protein